MKSLTAIGFLALPFALAWSWLQLPYAKAIIYVAAFFFTIAWLINLRTIWQKNKEHFREFDFWGNKKKSK